MGKGARAVLVILETIMYRQELCVFCVIGVEDRFFREIVGLIMQQGIDTQDFECSFWEPMEARHDKSYTVLVVTLER